MPQEELVRYIKQNLADGFGEMQIREALSSAGWQEAEIFQAFGEAKGAASRPLVSLTPRDLPPPRLRLLKNPKFFISLLTILIVLPLLTFAGLWVYGEYFQSQAPAASGQASPPSPEEQAVRGVTLESAESQTRDLQRLRAVAELQTALEIFYQNKKFYPQKLLELKQENILSDLPLDPKTGKYYLYTPLNEPPLHYSLSFLLETRVGSLDAGLHAVSPEIRFFPEILNQQEAIVRSATPPVASEFLKISDLSAAGFAPGEEVIAEIEAMVPLELVSARLIGADLDLLLKRAAGATASFRFTSPREPGTYEIKIFAFGKFGDTHFQKTTLLVTDKP